MMSADRRRWLGGAGAFLFAGGRAIAARADPQRATRMYDYLFFDLAAAPGAPPARALADGIAARKDELARGGGEVLGLFTPQLGWRARQAALLVAWTPGASAREPAVAALQAAPGTLGATRDRLTATLRPAPGERPRSGGVYVHRWFVVETAAVPEFLDLSAAAWPDFEGGFDARVFGLFTAERTADDAAAGVTRLLLLTRYGDHAAWEASRTPSPNARDAFARRTRLTRDSWAASSLLLTI